MPSKLRPLKSSRAAQNESTQPLTSPSWRVVEIEGEATSVTIETQPAQPILPALSMVAPPAMIDEQIIVGLEPQHVTVAVGETALFGVNLLNNGDRRAHFTLTVEGAFDPQWLLVTVGDQPPQAFAPVVTLDVGERVRFWLAFTPPRAPHSPAGDHALHINVRAAEYPGRFSQLAALLTILPYIDFTLGATRPSRLTTTWRPRLQRVTLPLINRSNQDMTFLLRSRTTAPHYRCELTGGAIQKNADGQAQLTLAAGQRVALTARITLPAAAWLRLEKERGAVQIAVSPLAQPESLQMAQVQIHARALLGPWQLATLFLLAGGGLVSALIFAVAMLVMTLRSPPPAASPPVVNSPPIAIVVNLAQPAAPTLAAQPTTAAASLTRLPNVVSLVAEQPAPDPALPIIEAAQISAPGASAPPAALAPPSALRPAQSAGAAAESPLTYQQMFQEIALRYDLNWRVLAAQAYIESGFDSLALGNSGDLGLMQILPSTWREWAPVANVTDPFDSYSNTLVAATYLDYLRREVGKKGYPQIEWMLVAYNWGIDKVLDHLAAGQGWDDLPAERRQYALDILRIAETIPVE